MGMKAKRTQNEVAEIRVIGDREYIIRADEKLLAKRGRWELSEFRNWRRGSWISLKLFDAHSRSRRRVYQIGYNVELGRLARNRHKAQLEERYPDICDWICERMGQFYLEGALNGSKGKSK